MAAAGDVPVTEAIERLIEIEGTVQGVGFRPFVARLARRVGVRGWVRNDGRGVQIRALGATATIETFIERLRSEAPPAARVVSLLVNELLPGDDPPAAPDDGFAILESDAPSKTRCAAVTPDLTLCDDCRRELEDAADRRRDYPFINCTQCGPRYSILAALPYDRKRTTMAAFAMCPSCQREYDDPESRRYHAEPNACPICGPHVELKDGVGVILGSRAEAVAAAAAALRAGRIVAVKGVGGFHLMVDATNESAVIELRRRKHREEKALAVMFPSLDRLRMAADVSADDAPLLVSPAAPIVLVRRKPEATVAAAVAPGNPFIGALLPYAPLQVLLLRAVDRPLVATSGNLSEEPLCMDDDEARVRLAGIADLFLGHNRVIAHPVDDSVLRPAVGGAVMLRRARGFAPGQLPLPACVVDALTRAPVLCLGGHLKNSVAVTVGAKLVVSPHLGDLGNAVSIAAFRRAIDLLAALHGETFARVVCDAHPDYASTRQAESLGLPVVRVQHHLAHILACLLEHGGGPERVLGVAWDGTGYGGDGTIWGGEFIVVDRVARTARRVAHLRPFPLLGGDAAIREPRRSALGVWHALNPDDGTEFLRSAETFGFRRAEADVLRRSLEQRVNAPPTTSAGRLFDAVAAMLGGRARCSFEGQAAMELEFLAARAPAAVKPWAMPLVQRAPDAPLQLDWGPLVTELIARRAHEDRAMLAARFHATLAAGILSTAAAIGIKSVVLTGGCFQNVRLLESAVATLEPAGFTVFRHHELPPNDGALAAGQAFAAGLGISSVYGWHDRASPLPSDCHKNF